MRLASTLAGVLVFLLAGSAGAGDWWQITVVDAEGNTGGYGSLALLPSGDPAISYYDETHGDLKYAERLAAAGDLNCDGSVNFFDIDAFVLALNDEAQFDIDYPDCNHLLADCNDDGSVDFFDIEPFVALITE